MVALPMVAIRFFGPILTILFMGVSVCAAQFSAYSFSDNHWRFGRKSNIKNCVSVSDYISNTYNATAAFTAAIATGKAVVDVPSGLYILDPVTLRSNQSLHFANGVTLCANPMGYAGANDSMFYANGITNWSLIGTGTVNQWGIGIRTDSQFRHGVYVIASTNGRIEGMNFRHNGGDGIFLGGFAGQAATTDTVVTNVKCEWNQRQGLSINHGKNITVTQSEFNYTRGNPTGPCWGIDIERDDRRQQMENILVSWCSATGNSGAGFGFYDVATQYSSNTVTVTFQNCTVTANASLGLQAEGYHVTGPLRYSSTGLVAFNDCISNSTPASALWVQSHYAWSPLGIEFNRCKFSNYGLNGYSPLNRITVDTVYEAECHDYGGVTITACAFYDSRGATRYQLENAEPAASAGMRNVNGSTTFPWAAAWGWYLGAKRACINTSGPTLYP